MFIPHKNDYSNRVKNYRKALAQKLAWKKYPLRFKWGIKKYHRRKLLKTVISSDKNLTKNAKKIKDNRNEYYNTSSCIEMMEFIQQLRTQIILEQVNRKDYKGSIEENLVLGALLELRGSILISKKAYNTFLKELKSL